MLKLGADDELNHRRAVREGRRMFSAYELRDGTRIWSSPRPTVRWPPSCYRRST